MKNIDLLLTFLIWLMFLLGGVMFILVMAASESGITDAVCVVMGLLSLFCAGETYHKFKIMAKERKEAKENE